MPVVRISDDTYAKLQRLATPFVDSPATVIDRAVDAFLEAQGLWDAGRPRLERPTKVIELDPDQPGELKHTRLTRAAIGGRMIPKPNWNAMLREVHATALRQLESTGELLRTTRANLREGRYEEDGYHYLPEVDVSIQGQDSNLCWSNSLLVARRLGVELEAEFRWLHKEGAANPGMQGRLRWTP